MLVTLARAQEREAFAHQWDRALAAVFGFVQRADSPRKSMCPHRRNMIFDWRAPVVRLCTTAR